MSGQNVAPSATFEQITEPYEQEFAGIEQDVLKLAAIAIQFSFIERVPRYTPETRENDAEHSFMLGIVGCEIAATYFPHLNQGLVAQFALVHDLLELMTGDVATFDISDEEIAAKTLNEHAQIDYLCSILPVYLASLLRRYEKQDEPEARFVRLVDKILPVAVDILGPGSQVMHDDYDTHTKEDLAKVEEKLKQRFLNMFPEAELKPLHIARDGLAARFEEVYTPSNQYALF